MFTVSLLLATASWSSAFASDDARGDMGWLDPPPSAAEDDSDDDAGDGDDDESEEAGGDGGGWTAVQETPPQEAEPDSDTEAPSGIGPTLPADVDLSEAIEAPALSEDQHDWLKPKRDRLPQNPYGQVDFTAYTLEWGEVKVGLAGIQVGVLPRTQLGTVPLLDALGVINGNVKVNFVRAGPFDLSLAAMHYQLPRKNFTGSFTGGGMMSSLRITEPWTLHVGGYVNYIRASGLPNPSGIAGVLVSDSREAIDAWYAVALEEGISLDLSALALSTRLATDIRFNRRDSIVFQFQSLPWSRVSSGVDNVEDIPPVLGADQWLNLDQEGSVPLAQTYVTSVSYQATWKQVDLRLGLGWSATPGAWLLQAFELSYRFGGKTRTGERRMRKSWRRNKDDVES